MLTFAEEITLLLHSDERGGFAHGLAPHTLRLALSGAVLIDLAHEHRIDADLDSLYLVDSTPVGDDLLDPVLADIADDPGTHDAPYWVERTAKLGDELLEATVARLVEKEILVGDAGGGVFLTTKVARLRRYSTRGMDKDEVHLRIMRVIFGDEIPDPRDTVIIGLADACGVFSKLVPPGDLKEAQARIDLIGNLDLIAQSVTAAIRESEARRAARPALRLKRIPEAKGWPILGNALAMGKDLTSFLETQYRQLGSIFRVRALNKRYIVLAGAEANLFVGKMGSRYFRSFDFWQDFNRVNSVSRTVISMDGPSHLRMRKNLADVYSRRLLDGRVPEAVAAVEREIDSWPRGRPFDAHAAWQRVILEQMSVLAIGQSLGAYADDLIVYLDNMIRTHLVGSRPKWMMHRPRVKRALRRVWDLTGKLMDDHMPEEGKGQPRDVIDRLIEIHIQDPQFLPETNLRAETLNPFIAGLDTAANINSFMCYEIARRSGLRARVSDEARRVFSLGNFDIKELRALDVTRRTAMETLRMYPITPVIQRTVANSFEFQGYRVQAGNKVLVACTVPHLMPEYYADPDEFDIDRFLPDRAEHRQPGVFAPFGVGMHRCLGGTLAEALLAINMVTAFLDPDRLKLHRPNRRLKTTAYPTLRPFYKLRLKS